VSITTNNAASDAFIEAFTICGNVSAAAAAAGIHPRTHYAWKDPDPEYSARAARMAGYSEWVARKADHIIGSSTLVREALQNWAKQHH
jgi:hypothetical protein